MPRRVLFLRNDPTAPEALLGEVFAESGFDVTTFEVVPAHLAGDPAIDVDFPDPTGYDVIVPLGARWSADDERLPWVAAEAAMVRDALAAGLGVLGVCFGGQLLARALGGSVTRSPAPEIGWHEVHSDDPGLVPAGPWFQWHFDRITVPAHAREVARNPRAAQAFVQGRAMGLQFHPEVDSDLVRQWIDEDADGDIPRLGLDPAEMLERTDALAADAAARLTMLVRGFLGMLGQNPQHGVHRLG